MYAIDTTLFYDINSIPDVEHSLNAELSKIADWLAANKYLLKPLRSENNTPRFYLLNRSIRPYNL